MLLALILVACGTEEPAPPDPVDDTQLEDTGDTGLTDGETWVGFAKDFFATYCIGCHGGGARDFTKLPSVRDHAEQIRCRVSPDPLDGCDDPTSMPPSNRLQPSDEERLRIVAWIEAGLPRE